MDSEQRLQIYCQILLISQIFRIFGFSGISDFFAARRLRRRMDSIFSARRLRRRENSTFFGVAPSAPLISEMQVAGEMGGSGMQG